MPKLQSIQLGGLALKVVYLTEVQLVSLEKLKKSLCFSRANFRSGGQLSIEDAQGNVRSMYLEDGFLDFLNKVSAIFLIILAD